jgi:PAS domain S-box-containing protein
MTKKDSTKPPHPATDDGRLALETRELRIRNSIANAFLTITNDDIFAEVLRIVLDALDSKHGLFGYLDDHGVLTIPSLTGEVWERCAIPGKVLRFPPDVWGGIWGRALTEKKSLLSNGGLTVPRGHIRMERVLAVPIIYAGKVIGLLMVGNRPADYEAGDLSLLETIAKHIAPILDARLARENADRIRKHAESEAKALARQVEFILGGTKTGLDIIDSRFNMKFIDPEWKKIYGDPTGRKCYEYFMDRKDVCPSCGIIRALETKTITVTEEVLPRENNRPVQVTTIPFQNEDGEWLVAEVNTDITERKRAEEKSRFFALAVENSSDAIGMSTPEGRHYYQNKAFDDLFGAIGERPPATVFVDEQVGLEVFRTIMGGNPWTGEVKMRGKAGELLDVFLRAYAIKDDAGTMLGLVGVHTDITERKTIEQTLRASEEKFRTVLDNANDGILVVDIENKKFVLANKAMCGMLGYTLEEICELGVEAVHPQESLPQVVRTLGSLARKEIAQTQDVPMKRKDGSVFLANINASPLTMEGRSCLIGVFRDITERKRAEEIVRTSKAFLDSVINAIADPIFVKDETRRFVLVNDALCAIVGRPREGLLGKDGDDMFPREQVEVFRKMDAGVLETGQENVNEESLSNLSSGEVRTIVTRKTRYTDPAGKRFLVGVIRDITERKRAEDALLFANTILSTQTEASIDGILVVDESEKIILMNNRFVEIWGIPPEVVASRSDERALQSILDKLVDPQEFLARVKHLYEHRNEKSREEIALRNERTLDRYSAPMLGSDGKYYGRVWYFRDITERKAAEDEIRRGAAEWSNTFDSISDFIFILDTESRITKANRPFIDAFGAGKEENVVGRLCFELLHKSEKHWPGCPLASTVSSGKHHTAEVNDPGIGVPLLVTTSPILDETGALKGIVHVARDISDLKTAERETKEAMEVKARFISMASHELRTPLTAIKESIDILGEELAKDLDPGTQEFFNIAHRNIDRLARLINDVLDFSKLGAGKMKFHPGTHSMNDVVGEVRATMDPVARAKRLSLSAELDGQLPLAVFDKDRITQVLVNLLNNAIKFTDKGSVKVSTAKRDDSVLVTVSDTGPGIGPEDLPMLFDEFVQFGTQHERRTGGTGLGLAISREIIERHKGRIWAESAPGKGMTVRFTIPVAGGADGK